MISFRPTAVQYQPSEPWCTSLRRLLLAMPLVTVGAPILEASHFPC